MKKLFSLSAARVSKRGYYAVLAVALLAIALIFSAFSHAPSAPLVSTSRASSTMHAARVVPDNNFGQQLEVETLAFSVKITGLNPNDETVSHCFDTPNYDTELPDWWWKGRVTIWSYDGADCTSPTHQETVIYVPLSFPYEFYPVRVNPYK